MLSSVKGASPNMAYNSDIGTQFECGKFIYGIEIVFEYNNQIYLYSRNKVMFCSQRSKSESSIHRIAIYSPYGS